MTGAQGPSDPQRASVIPVLVLALAFAVLVGVGIVTVLIPELQSKENKDEVRNPASTGNAVGDAGAAGSGDAGMP